MKKKIIIPITLILVLLLGFILWNNRTVYKVTMDINPSIEINLNKNKKVKSIKALNDDAKKIVNGNYKNKDLFETIDAIADAIIKEGYTTNEHLLILLHTDGTMNDDEIISKIHDSFREQDIEVINIETITKADKALAKKYNISPAKAAYINEATQSNEKVAPELLIDKSIKEIKETKETGNYCDLGYTLEGDFCLKEIGREEAQEGNVCPNEYYEYEGKCYKEIRNEEGEKLLCRDEFTLDGTTCTRTHTIEAEPVKFECPSGERKTRAEMGLTGSDAGDANYIVCVDYSNATHPVTPCELPANDPTERMSYGGKCYWHRAPVLPEGCPGSIQVAGECWQDASNIYICAGYRDGKQYKSKSEYCEHSVKYIDPVVTEYKCPDDYTLKGNKCEKKEIEDAEHERLCPSGYSLVNHDRCINYSDIKSKQAGYICQKDNSKVNGNTCIIYEIIEANH